MIDCNNCTHLDITEKTQDELFMFGYKKSMFPHWCNKYNRRLFHKPYNEPMIHPCDECMKEMEANNGT